MKYVFAISPVCLLLSGVLQAAGSDSGYTKNPLIKPGESYEACMRLSAGDKLYYDFTSSADLRFNIHFHENEEVRYPLPVRVTSGENAVFEAKSRKHYCLMWKNPLKESVELNLHYQRMNMDDRD